MIERKIDVPIKGREYEILIADGLLNMSKVVIHFFFRSPDSTGNFLCRQGIPFKDRDDLLTYRLAPVHRYNFFL